MHELLTGWYRDLVLLDYKNPDLANFIRSFKSIRDEGKHTIALSASGIYKLRNRLGKFSQQETSFLDEWLDGFLLSRSWGQSLHSFFCWSFDIEFPTMSMKKRCGLDFGSFRVGPKIAP